MATLTGTTIQSTYDSLLKVTDNDAITSTLKRITDGLGNNTPLYLSSSAVEITSGLNVIGSLTASNVSGSNTGDETKASIETKLGAATSSNNGYLTSGDWSTFNNKIAGSGTLNSIAKFSSTGSISDSNITDTGSLITLGSNSYVNGGLAVGTNSGFTDVNFRVFKNITGGTIAYGSITQGAVQSDVTNVAIYNNSILSTAASSFTVSNIRGYFVSQGTFGAGSTVTNQTGFMAGSSLIGATNNYGFYGDIAAGTGRWNLYMNGTANNYLAGSLGIGSTSLTGYNVRMQKTITGAATAWGMAIESAIQSDVTGTARVFSSNPTTQATAFTLTNLYHYAASSQTLGAGSAVTTQAGFFAGSGLTTGTNNYGFQGDIPSGTNRWNLFMSGTADNYINGALGISTQTLTGFNINIARNLTGAITVRGIQQAYTIQSDVTNAAIIYSSGVSTAAATFTLPQLTHYFAGQGTIGAGSTVTDQHGFRVESTLIGATNNYGFRGQIPAGTNRWNLYMDGTANNHLAGALGIGATALTGYSLRVSKTMTGSSNTVGINSDGVVQSDSTSSAAYFSTFAATQAASFTVGALVHYNASRGTIGAGSSITNQYGFVANSNLIGATNNYGFYGDIASGTGRWNLYMAGTANNYLAGNLVIGTTAVSAQNLRVSKAITGNSVSMGIYQNGQIQSDVGFGYGFNNESVVSATSVATDYVHYRAVQGTWTAGGTVTNQIGFLANSTLTSATNNFGFRGIIAAGTNRWNLYMDGTADNHLAGSLGIGTTALTGVNLNVNKAITGGTTAYGMILSGAVQSDVTGNARLFYTNPSTQAAAFTVNQLVHYYANQGTFGAGSTVNVQNGFLVESTLIGATNNYGFRGIIPSGTGRWNIYMDGTANNYLAGSLGIGATSLTEWNLRISKSLVGSGGNTFGIGQDGQIQSSATSNAFMYYSIPTTQATSFTLSNLYHYAARQGSLGAGSAITNQYGFWVENSLTGATNNYGFFGNIASGTNRWNLYMSGTASNYMEGVVAVGTASPSASAKVQINSTTQGFLPPRMTNAQRTAIASPAVGLMVYQTDATEGLYVYSSTGWIQL